MSRVQGDFRSTIVKLWERLGLPQPRFVEPGRVQLKIDGIGLDLIDNGRGVLVIEGVAGYLSEEPAHRAEQIRMVLNTNFGLLVDFEVGVYLTALPNQQTAITVRASCPFEMDNPGRLIKKLEDTVQTIEYYQPQLKSAAVSGARRSGGASGSPEPAVIFRP